MSAEFHHFRDMEEACYVGDFKRATLMALALSDDAASEGNDATRDYYQGRAQVYATLHQAEMALFIAENRQPFHPGLHS